MEDGHPIPLKTIVILYRIQKVTVVSARLRALRGGRTGTRISSVAGVLPITGMVQTRSLMPLLCELHFRLVSSRFCNCVARA